MHTALTFHINFVKRRGVYYLSPKIDLMTIQYLML